MRTGWMKSGHARTVLGMALVSLFVCGLLFPLVVTGLAQVLFPGQANGEVVQANGRPVGSLLIAQQFVSPKFLHPRAANLSASGVDPDIPLNDALAQVSGIHNATGIPSDQIVSVIQRHVEGTVWIFGSPYVNVLAVNLDLISLRPGVYSEFR